MYSAFKDNIWGTDLADMQLIIKFNKEFRFYCVLLTFLANTLLLFLLKIKNGISIVNAFENILKQSNRKPNKIWVDKGSEFCNNSFKKCLQNNGITMYSVVAERFIRTLKNKIYKCMTSLSKNVYNNKLDDIVNEYNNTYHRTIKMKPTDVKDNTYININKEVNDKNPKFKVGDHVTISK